MRKKIELEYILSVSPKILYSRLVTPSGLSEWFADDVYQRDTRYVFIWNKHEHGAILVDNKINSFVRFRWEDAEDEEEYFEFAIHLENLTNDISLIITDFVDDDEEQDARELWNKQVNELMMNLGQRTI